MRIYKNYFFIILIKMRKYAWCFTINKKDDEDEKDLYEVFNKIMEETKKWYDLREIRYLIMETEKGEQKERLHIQGFVRFSSLKSMENVKKFLGRDDTHLEPPYGKDQDSKKYCSKEKGKEWCKWYEIGTIASQGKRTDYDEFINDVREGMSLEDLYLNHSRIMLQNHSGAMHCIETLQETPDRDKSEVNVWYGASGSGKTTLAMMGKKKSECYFVCISNNNNLWFNGYNASRHKIVILDEFSNQIAGIDKLKMLLDQFQNQVEKKGGFLFFNPPIINITSQRSPLHWFKEQPSREDMIALLRRCKSIKKMSGMVMFKNVKEEVIKNDECDDPVMVLQRLENEESI
uniref:Replication-associated protein n=1 Tax=Cressdnaviricota sp. TaxID=2748378 RepID=A0A6M4B6C2_9VIRU|nr:replication-associated protein [Cressdnaviricota sp.]